MNRILRKSMKMVLGCVLACMVIPVTAEASVVMKFSESYRWRNDDGTESTATWKAPKNQFVHGVKPQETIRLRFCYMITGSGGSPIAATNYLMYSEGPDFAVFKQVPITATTQAFEMADSPWLSGRQATTAQLPSSSAPIFVSESGGCVSYPYNSSSGGATLSSTSQYANVEFCIRATTNAHPGVAYKFRSSGYPFDHNYSIEAFLLMGKPGDVNNDNVVNADDLNEVVSNFGRTYD